MISNMIFSSPTFCIFTQPWAFMPQQTLKMNQNITATENNPHNSHNTPSVLKPMSAAPTSIDVLVSSQFIEYMMQN